MNCVCGSMTLVGRIVLAEDIGVDLCLTGEHVIITQGDNRAVYILVENPEDVIEPIDETAQMMDLATRTTAGVFRLE